MVFALKGQDATAQGEALGTQSHPMNEALKERDEVAFYPALSGLCRFRCIGTQGFASPRRVCDLGYHIAPFQGGAE
jgi:hypothetical protein